MKKMELVFIPAPAVGHIVSLVEFAKRLLDRDARFSVTFLVIKTPIFVGMAVPYAESLMASDARLRFIHLPQVEVVPPPPPPSLPRRLPVQEGVDYIESNKLYVKEFIVNHILVVDSVSFAGLFVDMFTVSMIDVANELGLPCYLFYTSGAASLGNISYLITRYDRVGREFQVSDIESKSKSVIPGYVNPVPASMFCSFHFNKDMYLLFVKLARRFKETKAIIINSFAELESHAVNSLQELKLDWPSIYSVGPLIDLHGQSSSLCDEEKCNEIMRWLDEQPPATVVFLCFGSIMPMDEAQAMEIAKGLEQSGHRFLWSLRIQRPTTSNVPTGKPNEMLPQGFLERTKGRGMVCGWAPQIEVLSHKSIGGFVSHCGWNSILESLWYGVPILTWPMYAEQQLNAFQMVNDLGLAVEMRLDYKLGESELVRADELEKAINCLMEADSEVRKRVKKMSEASKEAVNGSSFTSCSHLIELMTRNAYIKS